MTQKASKKAGSNGSPKDVTRVGSHDRQGVRALCLYLILMPSVLER